MPLYDIIAIFKPASSRSALVNVLRSASKTVFERGGFVRGVRYLGARPLAYRMRAHQEYHHEGRFVRLTLQASPAAIQRLEHQFKVEEDLIRWLTVKKPLSSKAPKKNKAYSPAMAAAVEGFMRRYGQLDYLAATELVRKEVVTEEQMSAMIAEAARRMPITETDQSKPRLDNLRTPAEEASRTA